jgi:hypothetical protein
MSVAKEALAVVAWKLRGLSFKAEKGVVASAPRRMRDIEGEEPHKSAPTLPRRRRRRSWRIPAVIGLAKRGPLL